ncbi:Postreplication repair E3 ubiquitin-protein ligase [Echinococcus granulosus]|uniref:Postreplication repair E3 ubiquitin-protein ligase n=1 Tax=Echinococcus granulosus TaxID=6210 RepID=W6UEX3_ECHGR|nr:Postreplication repair E3 ubiquitin-protein ligase [Echinococcus granulosus]EUB59638.1 Postreplication repair E3 ubiquitin-protein ligase [Echinococcus granulosus]
MDESILECPVCLDEFKHPVMPPCQHAFCFSCILKYIRESGEKCPICRTAFAEEDLRRSLHIEQLLSAKSGISLICNQVSFLFPIFSFTVILALATSKLITFRNITLLPKPLFSAQKIINKTTLSN